MLEKCCAVVKVTDDTWKKLLFIEKIIKSHNAKYYVKSLKRNKKNHLISEGCKKKKCSEENIVLIHWEILQLLILAGQTVSVDWKDLSQI